MTKWHQVQTQNAIPLKNNEGETKTGDLLKVKSNKNGIRM